MTTDPIVKEAIERWQRCQEAEDVQRKAMLLAKQFRSGDQWPEEIRIQRQGGSSVQGQAAQPPRPCLTIDRLSQPVRQTSNTIRAADFSMRVAPRSAGADQETAKIYQGLLRKIQNDARAEAPIEWAADGAAEAGLGWFRIRTDYVSNTQFDPQDPSVFDQEIKLERITNSMTVYCDPNAQKPTRQDAQYLFVTEDLSKDEFKRRFKKKDSGEKTNFDSLEEFIATGDMQSWASENTVRIAEYWRVEYEQKTIESPDGSRPARKVSIPRVKCSLINAVEELQSWDWAGSRIPLIPILGEELNVDGKVILRGIIAEGMDAQRMVNYMYSAAIEAVALAPKAPLIVAEGQVEGYEALWQNANRFNYSYLPYKPVSLLGSAVPPPQRQVAEAPIEAMTAMLAKSEDAIKATTGIWDPSLGNTSPREKSGKAIRALQQQSELGQSNYLDNVQRALIYCADLLVELIPKIYDRPGRIVHILGEDDDPQAVMLNHPFQTQNGQPQPIPGMTSEIYQQQIANNPKAKGLAQFYDLSQGQYAVTVEIGKGYATKREEAAAILGDMLSSNPQLLPIFGDIYFGDLDFPGAAAIAQRIKKLPGAIQDEQDQQANVAQMQQQLQLNQKVINELTAHVNQLSETIKEKQVENQTKIQTAQMDNDTKYKIALVQQSAQLAAVGAKVDAENTRSFVDALEQRAASILEAHMQRLSQAADQIHETATQLRDHAHEQTLQAREQQHDRAMGATDLAIAQANAAAKPTNGEAS